MFYTPNVGSSTLGVMGDLWETEGRRSGRHMTSCTNMNTTVGEAGQTHDEQHVLHIKCGLVNSRVIGGSWETEGSKKGGHTTSSSCTTKTSTTLVCMCVCIYVSMYACMHAYMYACI